MNAAFMGEYESPEEASAASLKIKRTVEPVKEWVEPYREMYHIYVESYKALKDEFKALVKI